MLNQEDRRRLAAIEQNLEGQDPHLARRIRRPPWPRRQLILLSTLNLLLAATAAAATVTVGWYAALALIPIAAVSVVLVRCLRRYRHWIRPPEFQ